MIERKLILGLITSKQFIKDTRKVFDISLLESSSARLLANWALEYYDKYKNAPNTHIEDIYYKKLQEGLDKETAEEIEQGILPELSEDYVKEGLDIDFIVDEAFQYFKKQRLLKISSQIEGTIEEGRGPLKARLEAAEKLTTDYKAIGPEIDETIDLSKKESLKHLKQAFDKTIEPLIIFPKQLGQFWNSQFIPGAFIAFLAPEKRGKTFLLLEIAIRAVRQGKKVAFFQAGDMNEGDQLERIAIYLTKRNTLEKYCKPHFEAVRDCKRNQWNTCDKKERECDFGLFEGMEKDEVEKYKMKDYIDLYEDNEDYLPCYNCKEYNTQKLGTVWIKKVESKEVLDYMTAKKAFKEFFIKNKRQFKLATYPNSTLSFDMVNIKCDEWEEEDGFVADVALFDYFDIMIPSKYIQDFRHRENEKWKEGRKFSQTARKGIKPCTIGVTQSDADAYTKDTLSLKNFSEDKRKYAHVTAMYGLNQDKKGIEKSFGLLRINELILRKGDFDSSNQVTLIQNLRQGRPLKGSFFK